MIIGIVTQRLGRNYGGVLQNYALQQVLRNLGHNPITYDISSPTWIGWIISSIKFLIKRIIGQKASLPLSPIGLNQKEFALRKFIKSNISLSYPIQRLSKRDLYKTHTNALVVGSDQVWRPFYSSIPEAFLEFAKDIAIPKIAYAASFGVDKWLLNEEETRLCKELVKKLDAISVRETSGVGLCEEFLNVKAVQMPDPTLLLKKEDYNSLCNGIKTEKKDFVFAYILDITSEKTPLFNAVASEQGQELVFLRADNNISQDDSIERWLSFFRDSSLVITDSFHGTVFSIIFNKEFYVISNPERGKARIESLLNTFGLQNRLITSISQIDNHPINWKAVNAILDRERMRGLEFLKMHFK